jgi:hypothetical protein
VSTGLRDPSTLSAPTRPANGFGSPFQMQNASRHWVLVLPTTARSQRQRRLWSRAAPFRSRDARRVLKGGHPGGIDLDQRFENCRRSFWGWDDAQRPGSRSPAPTLPAGWRFGGGRAEPGGFACSVTSSTAFKRNSAMLPELRSTVVASALALAVASFTGCASEDRRLVADEQSCRDMGHIPGSSEFGRCMNDLNERRCAVQRAKRGGTGLHIATEECTRLP